MSMQRILSLTHDDLDGVAAGLAVKLAHQDAHVTTKFCTIDGIYPLLLAALNDRRTPYDRIVLSDIAFKVPGEKCPLPRKGEKRSKMDMWVNDELPGAIRAFVERGGELVVIDHHPGALRVLEHYGTWLSPESICESGDEAGSELAARYYMRRRLASGKPIDDFDKLLVDWCRLAGDFDMWRDPWGLAGKLSMALALMRDHHTAMQDMHDTINGAEMTLHTQGGFDWEQELTGWLPAYIPLAEERLDETVEKARASRVDHAYRVSEIHADFFPSLVAETVYNETRGVVLIRYHADRKRTQALSLRRHRDLQVDLGAFCEGLGGGGHAVSAGVRLPEDGSLQLDDVVRHISELVLAAA